MSDQYDESEPRRRLAIAHELGATSASATRRPSAARKTGARER
jgi:hypothetical protein